MLELFFPYEHVKSVFSIDYERLYHLGYKGIIFDIDMTLVPHGEDSTPVVDNLFTEIHAVGLKTMLLTNNDEERVLSFKKNIDTLYICDAHKPQPQNYLRCIEILGITKDEAIYIGDQIFVDIYGANRAGIKNILVDYVCAHEEKNIGIRRNLEKIILKLYNICPSYQHRFGDICRERSPY